MSLRRRIIHGASWTFIGTVITRVMSLATSAVIARFLGTEGFGEYGIIQSTVMMFSTFAGFGLGLTATKFVAECRLKDPVRAGRILGLSAIVVLISGGLLATGLFFGAPWLATRTLAAPHLAGALQITSLLIFLTAFTSAGTGALVGLEAFKVTAKLNLYVGLISPPLIGGGAFYWGLDGALWGLVATAAVNWLFNHLALRREAARAGIPIRFRGCLQERKVLWTFSLPAVISGMLAAPVNWICNTLLVNQPNGYAEMGIVNAANQWFNALLFVPGVLARTSIPVLSERLGSGDKVACRKILRYSLGLNVAVVVPLVGLGCFVSDYIMGIYGSGFAERWLVGSVAMVTAGVLAVQMPIGQMMAASGRMWTEIAMNLGWAVLFCGGTWIWVSDGALGLVSARLLAYLAHLIWTAGFVIWLLRKKAAN